MIGSVEPARFRRLMARWASGVSIVTAREGDRDYGMTVNALLSVSLTPPLLLVSLSTAADTTPVIERTRSFSVSLLSADQRSLSERFAQTLPPDEKFRDLPLRRGRHGLARLDGALGYADCEVRSVTPVADHRLIIGEAVGIDLGPDATPLVFHRSGYAAAGGPNGLTLTPPRGTD